MFFHSTRGKDKNKTFEEVLIQGLADDGGLYACFSGAGEDGSY